MQIRWPVGDVLSRGVSLVNQRRRRLRLSAIRASGALLVLISRLQLRPVQGQAVMGNASDRLPPSAVDLSPPDALQYSNSSDNISLPSGDGFREQLTSPMALLDVLLNHSTTHATGVVKLENPSKKEVTEVTWLKLCMIIVFIMLIVITVIGNTLVILSVLTTRRLRTVTNCFVMSLAVADWLVGLFVMPPAVAVDLMGSWQLGWILCEFWISLDVLLCTASILSLCAISIDRYLAVTQPLNYSRRRRSKRLALLMILVVWILAVAITCPPILGWYESGRRDAVECRYNQNKGYVVYSAMGSFFIPMLVMIYVYARISCVIANRHDQMSEIEVHKCQRTKDVYTPDVDLDNDNYSEQEPSSPRRTRSGAQLSLSLTGAATSLRSDACPANNSFGPSSICNIGGVGSGGGGGSGGGSNCVSKQQFRNGHYELVDCSSRTPSIKRNCKHSTMTVETTTTSSNNSSQTANHNNTSNNNNISIGGSIGKCQQIECQGGGVAGKTNNIRIHQKSLSNRILSLKRENKTTQTLAIVVGGFIACWLPFFIVYLITPFLPKHFINEDFVAFLTWLGWFNSAVNPFIYALYSVDFRAAFWRLTCRRFCKNMKKTPYASNTFSIRR